MRSVNSKNDLFTSNMQAHWCLNYRFPDQLYFSSKFTENCSWGPFNFSWTRTNRKNVFFVKFQFVQPLTQIVPWGFSLMCFNIRYPKYHFNESEPRAVNSEACAPHIINICGEQLKAWSVLEVRPEVIGIIIEGIRGQMHSGWWGQCSVWSKADTSRILQPRSISVIRCLSLG